MAKSKTRMPHAAPLPPGLLTPLSVLKEGESTVTMVVPSPVTITLPDRRKVHFKRGTQEVPARFKEHKYLAANGAECYDKDASATQEPKPQVTPQKVPVTNQQQNRNKRR